MRIEIIKILFLVILGVTVSSCSDFLNQEPISNTSVPGFYKTETDIQQAVNASYNALMNSKQYGGYFIFFMEVRSDNSYTESISNLGGLYGNLDLFIEDANNSVLNDVWIGCYDGIKRCNIVLDNIDKVSMSSNTKNKYRGEVLFIRALTYFNLVRLWGDVPLVTHYFEDPSLAFALKRTPAKEVYDQLIADLNEAARLLPDKADSKRMGAVLAGTANTLLGKVYLTLKDYSNATTSLKKVIDGNNYSLLSTYSEVFDASKKNSTESVFEIQYNGTLSGMGSAFANIFAPIGSRDITNGIGVTDGNNTPEIDFAASYDPNDVRKSASIGIIGDGRLYCKKFVKAPTFANQSDANFIVLRYADVLMMYAEAINEVGYQKSDVHFDYLNAIRRRAGLSEYNNIDLPNQAAFREAVYKERRYEFAFENQRWFDLLRTGKAIEAMQTARGVNVGSIALPQYKLLYPVPQSQIDISPDNMKQNPSSY